MEEQSRDGHPYFPLAGKGAKRTFTDGQKKRTVSYWHSGLPGGRASPNSECGSSLNDVEPLRPTSAERGISTRLAESMGGNAPFEEA